MFGVALMFMGVPTDRNHDGKISLKEIFDRPTIEIAVGALSGLKESDAARGLRALNTLISGGFVDAAKKYKVTPQFLASVVLERFAQNPPEQLNLLSGEPLEDRGCEGCALSEFCSSAKQPDRDACFL